MPNALKTSAKKRMQTSAVVIGAGLAGCEAAFQLARRGVKVKLIEQKPKYKSPAHHSDNFAELVCSNSLRAQALTSAAGLLKQEMRELCSLIIKAADINSVPAGGALAVDREAFSGYITETIKSDPNITAVCEKVSKLPKEGVVIAAPGPLSEGKLAQSIRDAVGKDFMSFYDAAAPIVTGDSIDREKAFFASRYGKGGDDYLNCPMDKTQYDAFYNQLVNAQTAPLRGFEGDNVFEGCMPVETMARRGYSTLLFGPLKPVGLMREARPFAVVQLRREDSEGRLYNMVGFQTHLKFGEQRRVFRMIPGLENAQFVRYGVMHRNTFIASPGILDGHYELKSRPGLFFAGQITGVEGYIESAASGLLAGICAACDLTGTPRSHFGSDTAVGALSAYVSGYAGGSFQPMNINFGIINNIAEAAKGKDKKELIAKRALEKVRRIAEGF